MMKKSFRQLLSTICLSLLICPWAASAQKNVIDDYSDNYMDSVDPEAELRCLKQNMSASRTYRFQRQLRFKAYGARPWFYPIKKIIPYWNDNETVKYTAGEVLALKELGLDIPLYETKRSQRIRRQIDEQLLRLQIESEENWNRWLKKNPNASSEENKRMEFQLRFEGLAAEKLPRFDWREAGLDTGSVDYQGLKCDTCWAFAARDAIQISRRLNARRAKRSVAAEAPAPSVRQLVSCMVKDSKFCDSRKPDEAFKFMVDYGLPLGGSRDYLLDNNIPDTSGWKCDKTDSVKALTWDYVSGAPQKVAGTAEIKRAVITYGAVVAAVNYDDCLALYASGVFNEEQFDDGSHLLLIIGWDDALGAWLVKNSYGKQWGDRGYGWIKYGSNNIGQLAAFVVADPQAEERFLR